MFTCTHIDHVGINTNDMEATLQFYCGVLGMRLVRTTRTGDGRRHYNVEIGGGNAFAVFDGAVLPAVGERQHVNHLALPVATPEEFDAAYQRLKEHGIAVTRLLHGVTARPSTSMQTASGCKSNSRLNRTRIVWKAILTLSHTCTHYFSGPRISQNNSSSKLSWRKFAGGGTGDE